MTSIGFVQGYYPQHSWAYDMFGSSGLISPSIMSPNDTLGAINDAKLFGNIFAVDALATSSAMLSNTAPVMMNQFWANLAKYWQQMMMNLQSTMPTISQTTPGAQTPSNPVNPITNPTGRISENKIVTILDRIGKLDDRLQKEGEFDGKKMTYLDRLKDLLDEYRKDPENARLSKENYEKIWDILSDCYKTGVLSSENWAALKKIDENHGESTTPANNNTQTGGVTTRSNNYEAGHTAANNGQIAETFFEALDGAATNQKDLAEACQKTDKYNVIEVIDEFNKRNNFENDETLIEAIFDDCQAWGNGVSKWYQFGTSADDAKPYVESLTNNMIQRAADISELPNCSKETKENLKEKTEALKNAIENIETKNNFWTFSLSYSKKTITEESKNAIIKAFNELHAAIKAAEIEVYGKED